METVTKSDVQEMTSEELAALKKEAYRLFGKFVAIKIGMTLAVVGAAHLLAKALDSNENETPETPQD